MWMVKAIFIIKEPGFLFPCPKTLWEPELKVVDWFIWCRFQEFGLFIGNYWLLLVSFTVKITTKKQPAEKVGKFTAWPQGEKKVVFWTESNVEPFAEEIGSDKREPCVNGKENRRNIPPAFQRSSKQPLPFQTNKKLRSASLFKESFREESF